MLDQRSRGNGGGACAQSGNLPHTPSPFIFHSVFLTVTHGFRASYIQPTWKAWMGPPFQQSVTQPVIARYVRLSASPCRLSRAHASGERVHAAGGQRVHAGCRSCVGKRCIVSALTRCVAHINQDNRRSLRLSSVGSLPLAKNALHSPTSNEWVIRSLSARYSRSGKNDLRLSSAAAVPAFKRTAVWLQNRCRSLRQRGGGGHIWSHLRRKEDSRHLSGPLGDPRSGDQTSRSSVRDRVPTDEHPPPPEHCPVSRCLFPARLATADESSRLAGSRARPSSAA